MKHTKTILAFMALSLGTGISHAQFPVLNGGAKPNNAGIVNNGNLPRNAVSYIKEYFPDETISLIEREFLDNEYEVLLSSGIELTFNNTGNILEIEAPEHFALTERVVRSMLPDKAYKFLVAKNYAHKIESIQKTVSGYEVDIHNGGADLRFTSNGDHIVSKNT